MKNNKGFSLVELLIVIALMGIIMGFASVGFSTLSNQRVKSASKDIYNTIGTAQTLAMSKENCYLVLTPGSVRVVYKNTSTGNWITVSESEFDKNITLYYSYGSSSYTEIDGSTNTGIVIGFDRSTGAFKSFSKYNTGYVSGGDTTPIDEALPDDIETIKIGQGSKAIRIELVKTTGKYSMEYGE